MDQLVNRFVEAYELGNLERFLSLFDERVKDRRGRRFGTLAGAVRGFVQVHQPAQSGGRGFGRKVVTPDQVQIQFRVKGDLGPNNLFGVERYLGSLDLAGTLRDGRLVITEYYQRKF